MVPLEISRAGKDRSDNHCQSGDDDQLRLRRKKGEEGFNKEKGFYRKGHELTETQPMDDGVYGTKFFPQRGDA